LLACSSSSVPASPVDGGATDAPSSDVGSPDAVSDATSEAGAPNTLLAWTGNYASGVTNFVFDNFTVGAGARCATQKTGGCYVIDCTAQGPAPTAIASGQVDLYSGAMTLLSVMPEADGVYPTTYTQGALWTAGSSIGIRSAGGSLPKFDVPLTAPATITVTKPVPNGPDPVITRSAGLTASWSGATGKVTVAVSQTPAAAVDLTTSVRFFCEFDGAAGTGSVPAAVTSVLSASAPATALNIGGSVTADVIVGAYPLHVYALNALTFQATVK
jgi:hypothetical protein